MAASLPLPHTLGKYTLVERIAAGGMAEVYRAKIYGVAGFEKTLAVKRILPHFAGDNGFVQMFVREANVAVRLSHANVVQVFELGRVGDEYYIALEFVEGKDLKALIRRAAERGATLPPELCAFIAWKVCMGLHHAHTATDDFGAALGIIHRDVSPHNVLLSWTGEVKVADFGIARMQSASRHTRTGTIKGKLAYMSPEQSEGSPDLDARSDLFAAGIVLYEMLTGFKPFDGESDREILKKIREAPTPLPSEVLAVPKELDLIVDKAMKKRREDRYPDCAAMGRALAGFLQKSGRLLDEESVAEAMRALIGPRPVSPTPSARGGGTPVLPEGALDAPAAPLGGGAIAAAAVAADDAPTVPPPTVSGARSVEVFAAAEPTVIKASTAPTPRIDPTASQATLSRGGSGSATVPSPRGGGLRLGIAALAVAVALGGAFTLGHLMQGAPLPALPSSTATAIAAATGPAPGGSPSAPATLPGLAPASAGTLRIAGTPAGALVVVDRTRTARLGEAIDGLAFGRHNAVVSADDYRARAIPFDVSAAQPLATPSVALAHGKGEIRIRHGSSNQYSVAIPGVTRPGQELEQRFENVDAGRYTATIRLGGRSWQIPVVVHDGAVTKMILQDDPGTMAATREFRPD